MYEQKDENVSEDGLGIFEIKKVDNERCTFQVIEQYKTSFNYAVHFRGKNIAKRNLETADYMVKIRSSGCIEYEECSSFTELWLEGSEDFGHSRIIYIPANKENYIREAIKFLGGKFVDEEPTLLEKNDPNLKTMKFPELVGDEKEQVIEEMLNKVDINTFMKVMLNRAYQHVFKSEVSEMINLSTCKEYLRRWAIAKYQLYLSLGRNLKIEKEIEVVKDENWFNSKLTDLKNQFPIYIPIFDNLGLSAFIENNYNSCYSSNVFKKDKRIHDGMKITKLLTLYGNKELDTELSKIYQEKGLTNLRISIDPIDYLTVSINKSGWKSCHNFFTGAYKDAPIAYMFDSSSYVAYTCGDDVEYTQCDAPFRWNSKNWRQMIYVDTESSAVVFSRQYPYESDELSTKIREFYEETVSREFQWENSWYKYDHSKKQNINVKDVGYVYNDIRNGFNHKCIINKFDNKYKKPKEIKIGVEYYERMYEK